MRSDTGLDTAPFAVPRLVLPIVAGTVLVLLVASGVVAARLWPGEIAGLVDRAAQVEHALGATGWLLALCIEVLIALCGILPASAGAFAAGLAFGVVGGFAISGIATLIGAVAAFFLARSLFRPLVARLLARRPMMSRLDEAVTGDGWRIVALMRVSPIMPFAMTSYALGLTSLSAGQYLLGTLASLPALFGYVLLGHLSAASVTSLLADQVRPIHLAILVLATLATGLLTWRLARMLQRIMRVQAGG